MTPTTGQTSRYALLWLAAMALSALSTPAELFQVGPLRAHQTLQDVADLLGPGDLVEVDGDTTYPGSVVLENDGTAGQPIVVRGLRVDGNRPMLAGGVNTIELRGDWYVLEGFEVTGGTSRCIYHHAANIVIRDVVVHDCPAHGILGADQDSGSLTLEYSEVYATGSGTTQHQIYMATDQVNHPGSVFRMRHCYIHDGNGGNNVKSRAERNEIYYNWIEGAVFHELELIGPDPGGVPEGFTPELAREDSDVVGNVLWKKDSTSFVTRVGGDATGETFGRYRFVNNTILASSAAVFRIFDGIESIEMHNNVIYRIGTEAPLIVRTLEADWLGSEVIAGSNNWIETGSTSVPAQWVDTLSGADPGLLDLAADDPRPALGSPLYGGANPSPTAAPGYPFPSPHFPPQLHPPVGALQAVGTAHARPLDGALDIGAFEYSADVFSDGFESGDTSAWSGRVPPAPLVEPDVTTLAAPALRERAPPSPSGRDSPPDARSGPARRLRRRQ